MPRVSVTRRYLALVFPWLPIERLRATRPHLFVGGEAPVAFVETVGQAIRLTATDLAAARAGLEPGLTLADARARVPELEVFPADPHADMDWLERLADGCTRYSPTVALLPPDALVIDIAGCVHAFEGERPLAAGAVPLLWLRTEAGERAQGRLHASGLADLGLAADSVLLVVVADESALLRAAADAARCGGLGMVLVESIGPMPGLDLTATRRLMLAAEASGVTLLSLRIDAEPVASAAATRWSVTAVPSTALDQGLGEGAPGLPAFDVECVRRRGGPAGQRWRVEWDRDAKSFRDAPLSGAGLSVAPDRTAARHPAASVRRR